MFYRTQVQVHLLLLNSHFLPSLLELFSKHCREARVAYHLFIQALFPKSTKANDADICLRQTSKRTLTTSSPNAYVSRNILKDNHYMKKWSCFSNLTLFPVCILNWPLWWRLSTWQQLPPGSQPLECCPSEIVHTARPTGEPTSQSSAWCSGRRPPSPAQSPLRAQHGKWCCH